jgi:hypothetical protein
MSQLRTIRRPVLCRKCHFYQVDDRVKRIRLSERFIDAGGEYLRATNSRCRQLRSCSSVRRFKTDLVLTEGAAWKVQQKSRNWIVALEFQV